MADQWYFAYGSNMDRRQKKERSDTIREARRARLAGYRLAFNKRGNDGTGKANIMPDDDCEVWGVIYVCSPEALRKIDDAEGVSSGHYSRRTVHVRCDSGEDLEAVAYVASEPYVVLPRAPSPAYLERIIRGARSHGLPEDYIQKIQEYTESLE